MNKYRTAIYLRLSQEDGDIFSQIQENNNESKVNITKVESNSISTQRDIAMTYISQHDDLEFCGEWVDDGYTGSNFERPQFQLLMEAVRAKEIDCILVKDLSRFGRDYIDAGNIIQRVLPHFGVRFIAINDNYDSKYANSTENNIFLPFKNLVNDSYARDISCKVRSSLEARRQNGICVASQLPFGYKRNPDTKEIEIDEVAADIVKNIFNKVVEGFSIGKIAKLLSAQGIPTPMEYKQANNLPCTSPFRKNTTCKWDYNTVKRIVNNEIYIGTLVQGKTTKISHRIKKAVPKERSQWAVVEDAVAPIITKKQFQLVQDLLKSKARVYPGKSTVHYLNGKIFCKDCNAAMKHRFYTTGGKRNGYFTCSAHFADISVCSTHSISEKELDLAVLTSVQSHVALMLKLSNVMSGYKQQCWEHETIKQLDNQIAFLVEKLKKTENFYRSVYEDYKDNIISLDEYKMFTQSFGKDIDEIEETIRKLNVEKADIVSGKLSSSDWFESFRKYKNLKTISRDVAIVLIDKVLVGNDKSIEIKYRMGKYLNNALEYMQKNGDMPKNNVVAGGDI